MESPLNTAPQPPYVSNSPNSHLHSADNHNGRDDDYDSDSEGDDRGLMVSSNDEHFTTEGSGANLLPGGKPPLSSRGEPKGPPQACLFVASLSPTTSEETLHEYFSQFGEVLKVKLMKDRSSRPYAFVQFSATDEANEALQGSNNTLLDGRHLRVEKAKVNRTLFIAKMSRSITNQKLREIVEAFGPVESVTIIKNHQTQKSRGCGFVKYVYREDAMDSFMGLKSQHRKWVVEWATSTNDPDLLGVDKYNVFIGGLNPLLISKEALEDRFSKYGPLESVTLIKRDLDHAPESDAPPRSAFAFLRYKNPSSSASAIEQENGAEWLERRIRVQYCESVEMKNKRRAQKAFISQQMTGNPYGSTQYYGNVPFTPMVMQMSGVPMYMNTHTGMGAPQAMATQKYTPFVPAASRKYQTADTLGGTSYYPTAYTPYYNPVVTYNQPWMYAQGQQQLPQHMQQVMPAQHPSHHHHLHAGGHDGVEGGGDGGDDSAGQPAGGGSAQLANSFATMSLEEGGHMGWDGRNV